MSGLSKGGGGGGGGYQGSWNPATNTPTLADGSGTAGYIYSVTADADRDLGSGSISFSEGDYIIYNGATWDKLGSSNGGVSNASNHVFKVFTVAADGEIEFSFDQDVVGPYIMYVNGVAYFADSGFFYVSGSGNRTFVWNEIGQSSGTPPGELKEDDAVVLSAYDSLIVSASSSLYHKHNLKVITTSASEITVTADELALSNEDGQAIKLSNLDVDIDIEAAVGVGALDVGSEATSTLYYVWVIYNNSTAAGLLSTSSSAPTLPSTYTYKRLVGEVYNDSSDDFVLFRRNNDKVAFNTIQEFITSTNPPDSYTQVSLPASIPTGAIELTIRAACVAINDYVLVNVAWDSSGNGEHAIFQDAGVSTHVYNGLYNPKFIDFVHNESSSIYWRSHANTTLSSNETTIGVKNYTLIR